MAVLLGGCGSITSVDEFVEFASEIALAPDSTCEELKVVYGVPHLPTVDNPGEVNIRYEEHYVTTGNGAQLRVWYVPADADRGTIVFSNGAVANMSCFLLETYMLRYDGWSVVMYDYEGFGGSTGDASLATLYVDLEAVLDWTLEYTGREQVTLMGVSLGSIPSVSHAALRPDDVNAVILDGVISLRIEAERFAYLLANDAERYIRLFDTTLLLDDQISGVTQPMLVYTYGKDEYATSAHVPELVADCPGDVKIVDYPNLPHARGPYLETATYFHELEEFLTSIWSKGDEGGSG
ncbi:MAG: alpha/beta hydrolase [Phycisphaerae bacterium]|nr:alpha/beta hydrolase [Phycisphaerae bacterium]